MQPHPWQAPRAGGAAKSLGPVSLQFFVMLLLVFLLEATITILFFAYTDKVGHLHPPCPHHPARARALRVTGPTAAVTSPVQCGRSAVPPTGDPI